MNGCFSSGTLVSLYSTRKSIPLRAVLAVVFICCGLLNAQTGPSAVGQWSATESWPYLAVHANLLPNGKVLFWPSWDLGDNPQIWDPAADTFTAVAPAGYNIFCAGHTLLANGNVFSAGGHVAIDVGLDNASTYDPVANTWTNLPAMNAGRWYPTAITLPSGDVLVASGAVNTGQRDNLPQIWQVASAKWKNLNGAVLELPLYPRLFAAPNGKVFYAGPSASTRYLDPSGAGAWSPVGTTQFGGVRDYGAAVMYDVGKVLLVGGGDPPTATAETIDLNAAKPAWTYTNSMSEPRRQLNATILPDGRVLVTGGSCSKGFDNGSCKANAAEVWNPADGTWTTWASDTTYRGYHSIAALLPDGRVVTAGGTGTANGEVFSPPYLFQGARPTIASAPSSITYGQTFSVSTPDAASINKVTLVRLSSVTHSFNANQRFNQLSFTTGAGTLNVTAPPTPYAAPPGHYMLFVINSSGVPSVASVVQILAGAPAATSVSPATGSTNGGDTITIAGSNFFSGATVQVGGIQATNVSVVSSSSITATTPAHAVGTANVAVTNPDSQKTTLPNAFTYATGSGISFVQARAATKSASVSSISATYSGAQTAGDLNIVVIGWNDATASVTSVTDSAGNTYTLAGTVIRGTNLTQAIYYAKGIVGAAAQGNTVTVQFDQAANFPDLRIAEYAGIDSANPLDATNGSAGTSLTSSSGKIATTAAKELVFAANTVLAQTLGPGHGYVTVMLTSFFDIVEHQIVSNKASYNASAPLSANSNWVMQIATFKAAVQ
ncbi:MAG TPA: galactose oxidase-like domain-containing protein [Terriglobales bacterium]|nr:galactose oxidase-like domain-containing protein [Terriglobales bacterium]